MKREHGSVSARGPSLAALAGVTGLSEQTIGRRVDELVHELGLPMRRDAGGRWRRA